MLSSVYHQTLLPPHRGWGCWSDGLKSYACWVPEHIIFSSTNACFWRKGAGPHMAKRCMGFPSVPNTMQCFSLNKLVSWSFKDFAILWKGGLGWGPDWKTALPTLILWAPWLSNVISPLLLLLSFFVGPHFSFPVCWYYVAHSSWHILLVLSDTLEGVKSLWVLFLILSGQQAYFQR